MVRPSAFGQIFCVSHSQVSGPRVFFQYLSPEGEDKDPAYAIGITSKNQYNLEILMFTFVLPQGREGRTWILIAKVESGKLF